MVARFNAIKHQNSMTSDVSGLSGLEKNTPKKEKRDSGRLDDYLKKEEVQDAVDGSEEQAERAATEEIVGTMPEADVVVEESAPTLEIEKARNEPASAEATDELTMQAKEAAPVASEDPTELAAATTVQNKPTLPPVNTSKTTLSIQIPSTPTTSTPLARGTPRSRRNTSIADAKKKLAAARKVSSSPKPSVDKEVLNEVASQFDERGGNRAVKNSIKPAVEDNAAGGEKAVTKDDTRENVEQATIVVNHNIGTKSKISISSPSARRSDKIVKIRARSTRIADRHKGLLSSLAPEPETKKRLRDEFAKMTKVSSVERFDEPKNRLSEEFKVAKVPSKETWSDEFNEPKQPRSSIDDARLSDDGKRLSYGSDTQTISDELNASRLCDEIKHRMSVFSAQRLSIESAATEASGFTLIAKDNVTESRQPQMKKTWQEQAKIAAKAKQYRKWQQQATPGTRGNEQMIDIEYEEESKENLGLYQTNVHVHHLRDDGFLFEPKPQVNGEGVSILLSSEGGLFEPRPQYKSDDFNRSISYDDEQLVEAECPLTPSQMAYLHENQVYHVDQEPEEEDAEEELAPDEDGMSPVHIFEMQDAVKPKPAPASVAQPSLSASASESSITKSRKENSVGVKVKDSSASRYKTLVPSRSDASKHSEHSLNQLTMSVSDAQSFVPVEPGPSDLTTPKLAGEEFLSMSKDTEARQPSGDFDDDQFQSNFDWPMDAFSPTSWGAGQPCSSSEDSKWDNAVPDTPNSLSAPAAIKEKKGWDFKAGPAIEWEEVDQENIKSPKKSTAENESLWVQTEWDNERDDVPDERDDDAIDEEARAEAEARICELSELGMDGASGIDRYEGFTHVEHADCPSRMESRDCASPRDEHNEVSSPGIESKCSEGTMGTATEFDPISMFGFSEENEEKGSFPEIDSVENDASAVSWASAKVLKLNDDATSAFASLRAGAPIDASTLLGQDKSVVDTPSGRESLGSWWQNRYASSQNNDVNAAVREALDEIPSGEERTDRATERCESSSRCKPEFATPKQPQMKNTDAFRDPLSSRTKCFKGDPASPDDDSIFGDLDDDSIECTKQYSSTKNKSRRKSSLSKMSNAETDDIFAGVSVNSRQANQQKDSSGIPMKSLLDGSTTTGSQSMLPKTKASSKEPDTQLPKVEEDDMKPMGLFMMDGSHGVINVPDTGRNSPTASVTSDITTSVIFGGDYGKKRSFARRGPSSSLEHDFPEAIIEIPDVLSDKPVCSPLHRNTGYNEDTENIDPQIDSANQEGEFATDPNRIRSLMSETTDEATPQSNPSLLKRAFMMVQNGTTFLQDSAKSKCASGSSGNNASESETGFKPSLLLLPLALPLACGVAGASSFAYCASKGKESFCSTKGKQENQFP